MLLTKEESTGSELIYASTWGNVIITYATSKGSGEPAHMRSLAKAFAVRRHVLETFRKPKVKRMSVAQT